MVCPKIHFIVSKSPTLFHTLKHMNIFRYLNRWFVNGLFIHIIFKFQKNIYEINNSKSFDFDNILLRIKESKKFDILGEIGLNAINDANKLKQYNNYSELLNV